MVSYFAEDRWVRKDLLIPASLMSIAAFLGMLIYFFGPTGLALSSHGVPINDFLCFWLAGQEVVQGTPAQVYDNAAFKALQVPHIGEDFFYPFFYPPTFLLMVTPLGALGAISAYVVSQSLCLLAAGAVCARLLRSWHGLLLLAAMPATFNAVLFGQNALLCAAFLGAGLVALGERRYVLAGVFIGLLTIKPQMGFLIPFALLAAGNYRTIVSASLTTIALAALSYGVLGADAWAGFFKQIAFTGEATDQGMAGFGKMASVYASMRMLGVGSSFAYGVQAVSALAALWLVWRVWRSQISFNLKAVVLISAGYFATPYVLPYDLAALGIAVAFLARETGGKQAFPYMWLLVAVAMLVPEASRSIGAVSGLAIGLIAPAIMLFVSVSLIRRAEPGKALHEGAAREG